MRCPECGLDSADDLGGLVFRCPGCGSRIALNGPQTTVASVGPKQNVAAMLCYLLGWITGLVFIKLEKDNDFVRFHAMQSIVTFGGLTWATALAFSVSLLLIEIPNIGVIVWFLWVLLPVWMVPIVVLWVFLMIQAYRGNRYRVRWIGSLAEGFLNSRSLNSPSGRRETIA